jgi:hypothetical protein
VNYQVMHLITPIKCWKYSCLSTKSLLVKIFATIFSIFQCTNLTKPSSIFFYTQWWWISICIIGTKKIKQQDFKNTWMKASFFNVGHKIRKSKKKNTMCRMWMKKNFITKTWQEHDKNMYPKLLLNKLKIMWDSNFIYTRWAPSSK